ncbi:MAG: zinc-binding dehydrogenase [Armatimonadetes bacterium]|nr:zinc-binding dehydrogenase [Armatimonadota bacterium]
MKAVALITDEAQRFSLEEVVLPEPAPDQIAVRTLWTGVSIGTEFALIRNKISWGPYPLCVGYQGTGVVEAVGADIRDFAVGDLVYFRGNDAMQLADGRPVSCVQGAHCSHAVLRPHTTHGAAHLPPGAPVDLAAMFVMPAVGLAGVDMVNPRMGATVVVYGAGLIGQGVIAACAHRGCVIIAVDINPRALEIARKMGADYVINAAETKVAEEVRRIVPEGADYVFECTGLPQCIDPAISLCRPNGAFVWQGNYGAAPVTFDFLAAHGRRLRMFFPCDDGFQPCRRAVIKNMAMGTLHWEHCVTHRIEWTEAAATYERINRGDGEVIGVLIHWSD